MTTHTIRYDDGWVFRLDRTPSVKGKKTGFCPWWGEEGQSGRSFPPQRPRNSTWTRGGERLQGVNLDFQRRGMNYEGSRNLPTGKCHVISGKSVGCGRSAWRKGFSKVQFTRSDEARDERGRLHPEGTQKRTSIRLLLSTGKVFVLRLATTWVCVFPVFPTNKKNEPQFVLQTQKCRLHSDTLLE